MFLISFLSHVWAQAQKNVWTHSPPYKGPISTDITLWQNECLGYCQFPTPPPPFCLFVIFIFSISFGSFCVLELCNWTPVVDLEMISGNLYRSLWLLFSFVIIVIIFSVSESAEILACLPKIQNLKIRTEVLALLFQPFKRTGTSFLEKFRDKVIS